jgi:uncharacterized protein YebE (UPF0316 family)
MFLDLIIDFFTAVPWWELLLILVAKMVEVSLGTLRIILVNKGYRKQSVFLALIEIFMWVFIAAVVIEGLQEAPIKGIVYGLGFAGGVFFGSLLEKKLAFGMILIEAISSQKVGLKIAEHLREQGYGVTTINAQGKVESKTIVKIFAKRRDYDIVAGHILKNDPKAMIISEDITKVTGGFVARARSIFK